MSNERPADPGHDDTQEVRGNPLGTKGAHFGNEYDSHEARLPAAVYVGQAMGGVGVGADRRGATSAPNEAIPSEAGARATIDQKTGAVHGSGSGAGGGQPGEDFDQDSGGDNVEQGGR